MAELTLVEAVSSTRTCAWATTGAAAPTAKTEHINARSHVMVICFLVR